MACQGKQAVDSELQHTKKPAGYVTDLFIYFFIIYLFFFGLIKLPSILGQI